jgi:uncharacterized protein YegL
MERIPVVLLIDDTESMRLRVQTGESKIAYVSEWVRELFQEASEFHHGQGIDIAVVTFGGSVTVERDFRPINQQPPPELSASGLASLDSGILRTLELYANRNESYRELGYAHTPLSLFLISDGENVDLETGGLAQKSLRSGLRERMVDEFVTLGVPGAQFEVPDRLGELCPGDDSSRQVRTWGAKLDEFRFNEWHKIQDFS